MTAVRVLVVDNHDVVLAGVGMALAAEPEQFCVVGTYREVSRELIKAISPGDVVVLDLHLGRDDCSAVPWIPVLVKAGAAVVIYTSEERPVPLRTAIMHGASGVSLKNDGLAALRAQILRVHRGEFGCSSALAEALLTNPAMAASLSLRERQILQDLSDGLTRKEIAKSRHISLDTVAFHLKSVRAKYLHAGRNITNVQSLVREATEDGWLH